MPKDHPHIDELFEEAIRRASGKERAEYLDAACGDDSDARRRVERLLQAFAEAGSFLESPASDPRPTLALPPLEDLGHQIGPYRLLEQIGEGGMGVVYMAQQHEPVRRKVALKIIKPGMDTRQVLARFDAERQALSLMDHPNIARVLDAGMTDRGRPYFVMELVRGQPITEYCDQHHLTPRQRLELLLPVCQAIQHAHQKGIIHRDIKPSNILVAEYDQQVVPKVIDFGVAKAVGHSLTEKTLFTGFGQIVGTFEYMSPEQAKVNQLDIDTRSDIYSLGVVLYELLTGTTPFDKQRLRSAAWDEMLRIIREEEPPTPSTKLSSGDTLPSVAANRQLEPAKLSALVRGELDWIVMKALEKDRARRYETTNGLALDIQRYLNDEPLAACPPSAAYRFRKFARRNKVALATTGFVAAALLLGLGGTSWQAIRATAAERQARASEQRAIHERDQKEAARREALQSAERAQRAAQAERQAKEAEAEQRKRAEAAAQAERHAKQAEAQQRREAEAAQKIATEEAVAQAINEFLRDDLLGMATVERQLKVDLEPDPNLKLATLLDRALATVEERFTDQPRVRAEVQATLARAFHSVGRAAEAEQLWKQVRQYRETTLGAAHPQTLQSMNNLAAMYWAQGRSAEAEPLFRQTLEMRRRVLGPEHPHTLESMNNLAQLYKTRGQHAEAEPLFTQTLEIQRRVLGPEHPHTLTSMNNLAQLYKAQGKHTAAEPLFLQTLETQRRVLGPEHPSTLTTLNNLAGLYEVQGKLHQAEPLYIQALEIRRRVLGPEHPSTLTSMNNLAALYQTQGKSAEAEPIFAQTLEIRRRVLGPEHPDTLQSMNNLAVVYGAQKRSAEAEPLFTQTLDVRRRVLGPEHPNTLISMNNLAGSYEAQGRYAEAQKLRTDLLTIQRRALSPDDTALASTLAFTLAVIKAVCSSQKSTCAAPE